MSTNTVIMVMIMPNAKPAMRSFLRLKRKEKIIIEMQMMKNIDLFN